jgi:hypothetical protein
MSNFTEGIIAELNSYLRTDPDALNALLSVRIPCNAELQNTTCGICVGADVENPDPATISLCSVLNGLLMSLQLPPFSPITDGDGGRYVGFVASKWDPRWVDTDGNLLWTNDLSDECDNNSDEGEP